MIFIKNIFLHNGIIHPMRFTTLFFDLDDTLYPNTTGLWKAIKERMNDYMRERLQIPAEDISSLREKYYLTYGTTTRGLQIHHNVDTADFLAYVHDLPLADPWDFEEVYGALHDFARGYPFETDGAVV